MGGKRVSKRYPVFFHLAIGLGVLVFLSGCQGIGRFPMAKSKPDYETDFQYLEQVRSFIGQGEFSAALSENEKLEMRSETLADNEDYARVIMIAARINASLLEKIIQEQKTLSKLSGKLKRQELMIKKQTGKIDKLISKAREMNTLFKALADLELENKTLQQQIKDFKEIDLKGHKINEE